MSILETQTKKPVERLDYDLILTDWMASNDRIKSARIEIDKPGLSCPFHYIHDDIVKVWIAHGVDGEIYRVSATVETEDGRVKQVEFKVRVKKT